MLRIVPRPPLSANVTLQQRLLPAATRGVATAPPPSPSSHNPRSRSNKRSRLSLVHIASLHSLPIRRVQSPVESPESSLSLRKISGPVESPRSKRSLLSARSDPVQTIPDESPTGNDDTTDGKGGLNQAVTVEHDALAGETAKCRTEENPPPQLDAPVAESAKDPIQEHIPPELGAPAAEPSTHLIEEHLASELDGSTAESPKDLTGENLPSELDSPGAESTKDLTRQNTPSKDGLSGKDTGKQLFDTPGSLELDSLDQPESITHATPQFDALRPSVGGESEPSKQETRSGSSPSKIVRKVSPPNPALRLSNLPDNITGNMLLNAISIHGPFGKVLQCHIRHLAGTTHALIFFESKSVGESLFKFVRDEKLIIGGRGVRCRWHPSEYILHYAPWRTRVLVVAISQDLANYNFLGKLKAVEVAGEKRPDIVVEPVLTVGGWVALVCTFLDVGAANSARERLKADGLRTTFGEDPVAVGAISAYEANLRLAERLLATTFRREGIMEDQVVSKSIAELAQERLEQQVKTAPPPDATVDDVSLDPFVGMAQAPYRPTARGPSLDGSFSFPFDIEEWEEWEDNEPSLAEPVIATSAPAAPRPGESPTTEKPPSGDQQPPPGSNQGPKSNDEILDDLEDIDKVLDRVLKQFSVDGRVDEGPGSV